MTDIGGAVPTPGRPVGGQAADRRLWWTTMLSGALLVVVGTAVRCLNADVRQHVAATGSSYIYVDWEYLSADLVAAAHDENVEVATLEGWHDLFYGRAVAWGVDIVLAADPPTCRRRLLDAQQR